MEVEINLNDNIEEEDILAIYRANNWSSAEKPKELMAALRNSHSLVTLSDEITVHVSADNIATAELSLS